jgi:UDP-2,3-diacylglucosamine pyrophosphatase LpxH
VGLKREKIQSVSSNYFFLIKPTSQRERKKSSVFKKWIEKRKKTLERNVEVDGVAGLKKGHFFLQNYKERKGKQKSE